MKNKNIFFLIIIFILMFNVDFASAQSLKIDLAESQNESLFSSRLIQIIGLLTVLSLAPSILIMVTSFTRVVIVLSFLRTALGLQQTPPNSVLISLALFLTFFIMAPTFQDAYDQGLKPMMDSKINETQAFNNTVAPFKTFMLTHTREKDFMMFANLSKIEKIENKEDTPIHVVVPAFMLSELKRAFEIGFLIFLPFLIIDLLVASTLMAMGMMMIPPVMISLPFKLIFFVLIDGWYMLCGSLIKSYGIG